MKTLELEDRLTRGFSECKAAAIDVTGAGNNFELRLSTPDLLKMSRLEQHQAVMALFKKELTSGEIHALTIKYVK